MKHIKPVAALALCLGLAGCAPVASEHEQLEASLPAQINYDLTKRGIPGTCDRVQLVESKPHNYKGTLVYNDGTTKAITVTKGAGGVTWKFN